jgi:hypothetical protein
MKNIKTVIPFRVKSSAVSAVERLSGESIQAVSIKSLGAAPLISMKSRNAL